MTLEPFSIYFVIGRLRNTNAPKEAIHVFINDMPEGTYYPQGEMKRK